MKQRTNRVFVSLKKIEEMAVPENPFANEFLDSFSIFFNSLFFRPRIPVCLSISQGVIKTSDNL